MFPSASHWSVSPRKPWLAPADWARHEITAGLIERWDGRSRAGAAPARPAVEAGDPVTFRRAISSYCWKQGGRHVQVAVASIDRRIRTAVGLRCRLRARVDR